LVTHSIIKNTRIHGSYPILLILRTEEIMLKSEGGSPSQLMLPQPEHWQLAVLVGPTKAIGLTIKRVMDWQRYTALADRLKTLAEPRENEHQSNIHS